MFFSAGSPTDTLSLVKVRIYEALEFYRCAKPRNEHCLGFKALFALVP